MFCVHQGNQVMFFDEAHNMIGSLFLDSDVVSAYVNESGVGGAVCEDGSCYEITCRPYEGANYYRVN